MVIQMDKSDTLFILAGNGSYYNRGCEAITRGTVNILRNFFDRPRFIAVTAYKNEEQFRQQRLKETDTSIIHKKMYVPYKRFDFLWFLRKALMITYPRMIKHITYKGLKPHLGEAKAVLALGGDNYSVDYGKPSRMSGTCTDLDDLVVARRRPLVIWGASVGPFSKYPAYERYMINHLRKVYILARETRTVEYLAEKGLTENVYTVADPAFLMEPTEPKHADKLEIQQDAIGLNLSPLMKNFVANGNLGQWTVLAVDIVRKILEKTGRKIYLIPHVTGMPYNDDYLFLNKVLSSIPKYNHRVVLIPPIYNASETKWIISKMQVFAGSRMHSTVSSLSSCVPTLSFAYSIKARGLNKDIFGHQDYCLSPDELVPDIVAEKFEEILQGSTNIRQHLERCIPTFKDLAMSSGEILQKILQETSP